ncbi:MAG TPA: ATP-binding cassette domain-containing protein [Bryobacteraceae bacterium]|nr:ATP-binding cassette domain-containing protein [Bryobacteraceae bacterium]
MDRPPVAVCGKPLDGSLMTAVEFRQVSYRAGGLAILDQFTLAVQPGETLVLLGRSGAGKTTALKMVNGLVFPTTGEIVVEGRTTTAWDLIELRRSIGYVIQEVGLFPHLTVAENVGIVPRLKSWTAERIAARTRELLTQVDLAPEEFAGRYPRQLSGGQRQRVGVARALAAEPRLLLFDEPFGALDPVTRLELQNQFLALRERLHKTCIFVTHDVREALRLGTRIALLDRGRLETLATPDQFLKSLGPQTRGFLAVLDQELRAKGEEPQSHT